MDMAENKEMGQRHDKGYKDILSNKDAFLHFLKKYVAQSWTEGITADDIERIDKSFITQEYRNLDSDLIYKLRMNDADVYLYVLLELQSSVDHTMPFRLLRYMVELLNDIFKNTEKEVRERKGFKLPAVVPVVLYNGDPNWTVARAYREYTENSAAFGESIIDFQYHLFDLKRTDKAAIQSTLKLLDVVFSFDKCRFEKIDLKDIAERLVNITQELTADDVIILTRWLTHTKYDGITASEIKETIKQTIKNGEVNNMSSVLGVLIEESAKEGMEKRATEIARNLVAKGKMTVEEIAEATTLSVDDILKLQSEM